MLELIGTILIVTILSIPTLLFIASVADSIYLLCKEYIYDIENWSEKTESRIVTKLYGSTDVFFANGITLVISLFTNFFLALLYQKGINPVFAELVSGTVLIVGGVYSMLRLARATVRLRTKLDKHMSDLNAHKGGDI